MISESNPNEYISIGLSDNLREKFKEIERDFELDKKGLPIVGFYFNFKSSPLLNMKPEYK